MYSKFFDHLGETDAFNSKVVLSELKGLIAYAKSHMSENTIDGLLARKFLTDVGLTYTNLPDEMKALIKNLLGSGDEQLILQYADGTLKLALLPAHQIPEFVEHFQSNEGKFTDTQKANLITTFAELCRLSKLWVSNSFFNAARLFSTTHDETFGVHFTDPSRGELVISVHELQNELQDLQTKHLTGKTKTTKTKFQTKKAETEVTTTRKTRAQQALSLLTMYALFAVQSCNANAVAATAASAATTAAASAAEATCFMDYGEVLSALAAQGVNIAEFAANNVPLTEGVVNGVAAAATGGAFSGFNFANILTTAALAGPVLGMLLKTAISAAPYGAGEAIGPLADPIINGMVEALGAMSPGAATIPIHRMGATARTLVEGANFLASQGRHYG